MESKIHFCDPTEGWIEFHFWMNGIQAGTYMEIKPYNRYYKFKDYPVERSIHSLSEREMLDCNGYDDTPINWLQCIKIVEPIPQYLYAS